MSVKCVSPVVLRSGLVVPCGKCLLCRQRIRDDWSVRLQLTAGLYDTMPLMCTFTYRDEDLTYIGDLPTVSREDVSLFIKRLKDRLDLYNNQKWAYFGCCEYGGRFGRPHAHILFFGFDFLQKLFDKDVHSAENFLAEIWQKGHVDVCQADWSGVHYVTKYCLKDKDTNYDGDVMPSFTFCSRGIGKAWLNSRDARTIRRRLAYAMDDLKTEFSRLDRWTFGIDYSSLRSLRRVLQRLEPLVPDLVVRLPSGRSAPLPRYYKKRLIGSFEHFKDNPFWQYNSLSRLADSLEYDLQTKDYNSTHDVSLREQRLEMAINSITKRLLINKNKKQHERI